MYDPLTKIEDAPARGQSEHETKMLLSFRHCGWALLFAMPSGAVVGKPHICRIIKLLVQTPQIEFIFYIFIYPRSGIF